MGEQIDPELRLRCVGAAVELGLGRRGLLGQVGPELVANGSLRRNRTSIDGGGELVEHGSLGLVQLGASLLAEADSVECGLALGLELALDVAQVQVS